MKRFILFTLLLVLVTNAIAAETNETIYSYKDPIPPGPIALSVRIPITANTDATSLSVDINSSVLAVYLDSFVGLVTITVYDASNQIVEQDVANTTITPEVYIPVYLWDSGYYTLTVNDGATIQKTIFYISE